MWIVAYRLSRRAEDDLILIYERGIVEFGVDQADRYRLGLQAALTFLAEFPHAARERAELTRSSRAHPYKAHLIFYRIKGDDIFVQRVRSGREDWTNERAGS